MEKLFNKKQVSDLRESLLSEKINTILIEGVYSSAKSFLMSELVDTGLHLILLDNREDASSCVNDLYNIKGDNHIYFFPSLNKKDNSSKIQRTSTIGSILEYKDGKYSGEYIIVVAYKESLDELVLGDIELKNSILEIKKGDSLSFDFIRDTFYSIEFTKVDFVSQPGEFAIRGGIIDVFSFGDDKPYRIEFFGDDVEFIKTFDANTQRSVEEVKSIKIFSNISSSNEEDGIDFLSLLPPATSIWISGISEMNTGGFKSIFFNKTRMKVDFDVEYKFNTSVQPIFNKQFDLLEKDISDKLDNGYKINILSESESQIERIKNILSSVNVNYERYTIQDGFIDNDSKVCFYTDHQIFNRYRRVRIKNTIERSERIVLNEINSLRDGDYVVHIDHGVCRFGGLLKNNMNGKIQEAVKLVFKDNDVLFVSIHNLYKISKYKSGDASVPKINKLGTATWQKLKTQTKEKAKEIAQDLIKLYSERLSVKGYAFSEDSYIMDEFESAFKYEETPDQLKAVRAVKLDMEKNCPMDRLVCGDVGFGKTEVAMRAAFKAVLDSKQVAVLVPTTILSLQHYNSFKARMKAFPCNIEYVSRLRTAKEMRDIVERLKMGKIDILIGTHKILSKDLIFKDLGLLIIDEEQKFGVVAKEKLKTLKTSVDTLTLSATPIPRTLQFSLFGARDLSIINTPPPNRLPISTDIISFDENKIKEIIEYEIDRGGQIFFVHNRINDIENIEDMIMRLFPKIKTCVAHGQMDPKILERKIMDYMNGDYDILIATSIIENGIDIPNTNTIIINNAQNFGLSDLHQLRGRVGRSNRKAFCYLIVPSKIILTDDANRRLKAIEAFSDLGSGFNISMQDLDIRGMGNVFGAEQSGYIAEMGFETYQKILKEAFMEIREEGVNGDVEYVKDCIIDTDMQLLIPDSYINIPSEKIRLYRELDSITEEEDLQRFINQVEDRFGSMPEEFKQLCYVVRLRREAKNKGFEKIVLKNEMMLTYFISNPNSDYYRSEKFMDIINYVQTKPQDRYIIKEQKEKLYIIVKNVRTIKGAYSVIEKM